jgi:hypothetical protein
LRASPLLDRRKFLIGMLGVAAAPMIVRASSLMPVRSVVLVDYWDPAYPGPFNRRGDLRALRELLLPGLRHVFGSYPAQPSQWYDVFI